MNMLVKMVCISFLVAVALGSAEAVQDLDATSTEIASLLADASPCNLQPCLQVCERTPTPKDPDAVRCEADKQCRAKNDDCAASIETQQKQADEALRAQVAQSLAAVHVTKTAPKFGVDNNLVVRGWTRTHAPTEGQAGGDGGKCKWYLAVAGVVTACIASSCSALANVLVRWSHVNEAALPESEQRRPFMRFHMYPIFFLYVMNGLIDSVAYALAPISLLAPTSALTIVINALAARVILGEVMTRTDTLGTSIIFGGAILCTVFGSKQSERHSVDELKDLYGRPAFVNFTIWHGSLLTVCLILSLVVFPRLLNVSGSSSDGKQSAKLLGDGKPLEASDPKVRGQEGGSSKAPTAEEKEATKEEKKKQNELQARSLRSGNLWSYASWGVTFAALTAGVAAWTNLLLKSFVEMIAVSIRGDNQMKSGTFWLLVSGLAGCALLQIFLVCKMFDRFEALFIVPMFQSLVIIFLIVSGGTYFDEWRGMATSDIGLFCTGCVVCLFGIAIMACQDEKKQEDLKVTSRKGAPHLKVTRQ